MRFRDRLNELGELELRPALAADPASGPAPGSLSALRQTGEAMLDAADDVIERTLSGDSEAFLSANRQEGGE
jgi:hypothetical protein